jgi:hypothetical protein
MFSLVIYAIFRLFCLKYKFCDCIHSKFTARNSDDFLQYHYLITYSMVHDIILKADCHTAYQKTSSFLHGTRKFITAFTKARHWTLSRARWIQFALSIPISLRSRLMLSSHLHLGLRSSLLTSGLSTP